MDNWIVSAVNPDGTVNTVWGPMSEQEADEAADLVLRLQTDKYTAHIERILPLQALRDSEFRQRGVAR